MAPDEGGAASGGTNITAVFPAGSLGIELQQGGDATPGKLNCWATNVVAGGAAATAGVAIGDRVLRVAGEEVSGIAATDVTKRIIAAARPVEIVFKRQSQAQQAAGGGSGSGAGGAKGAGEARAPARTDADGDGVPDDVIPPLTTWKPPKESYRVYDIVPDPAWEKAKNFLQSGGI